MIDNILIPGHINEFNVLQNFEEVLSNLFQPFNSILLQILESHGTIKWLGQTCPLPILVYITADRLAVTYPHRYMDTVLYQFAAVVCAFYHFVVQWKLSNPTLVRIRKVCRIRKFKIYSKTFICV